ncbi:glycoside hydrolase family 30 beta sandwich domain-containing protein [Tunturiibacter lichenicola]|uniref:glycoside hydrolase family 30 beta sandwich domain-containing protein n=1 Tax=Tunturiibacter lichenicola TaxID=2051959 RepID=UPI0021B21F39|nr:glycoside hydrolase family 30 beta sandwich domain-containing protein [Edaphobacter lichenicola]
MESVAFQNNDGSIVLLVFNNRPDTAEFDITWSGSSFHTSLPAQSLATYIWPRRHGPKT